MSALANVLSPEEPGAIRRLAALAELAPAELDRLRAAAAAARTLPQRREFVIEGQPIREPRLVLSGWACRTHTLSDGRRQVLGFLLPGDLIGFCHQPNPIASASMLALTPLTLCLAPTPESEAGGLAQAYAVSAATSEHYLLRQITRLGRLNAYERVADWLMEIRERLALAGLADDGRFSLPLTQELIADTLGLTNVHVNRTIQALRKDGLVTLQGGMASFPDMRRLEAVIEHRPAQVSR